MKHRYVKHEVYAIGAEQQYHEFLAQGQFKIQQCQHCFQPIFYPRMLCPHCGADDLIWLSPSGKGVVYSTTVVHRKAEAGGNYNVALIELEEGVRLMSRVEGIDPAEVSIGLPVTLQLKQQDEGVLVVFVPAEEVV